jgi:hypothetical protein
MDFDELVNNLSDTDVRKLYTACVIRLVDTKRVVVDDDIVHVWKTNKLDAILKLRERFPNYGLNELKRKIYNKLQELKIPLRDGYKDESIS